MKKINWLTGTVLTAMASLLVFPSFTKAQENPFEFKAGGDDASIPYVITPRFTSLSNSEFPIRWNEVEGANSYVVTIQGEDGLSWTKEVNGTETVYDGEVALEPDVFYLVTVEADNGVSSSNDQGKNLAFALANDDVINYLETETAEIHNSDLTPENQTIALADLYDQTNLNAEAIAALEDLVAQGSQTALVYQMLGDLYAETGLNSLAEESYLQAIVLAESQGDLEVLTNTQAGLAGVNIILGNHFQAGKLAQQAEIGYQLLGNDHHAMILEETLMTLMDQDNPDSMALRATRGVSETNPFNDVVAPQNCVPGRCF